MKQSHDVIVVGAGPAGATLAYELGKRGIGGWFLRVLFFTERIKPFPGMAGEPEDVGRGGF